MRNLMRLSAIVLTAALIIGTSCGKLKSDDPARPLQGWGELSGSSVPAQGGSSGGTGTPVPGNSLPGGSSTGGQLVNIGGNGSTAAPLGTNPLYQVTQGGAVVTPVHSTSRAGSALQPGQIFRLIRITLANRGQAPDWTKKSFAFKEGDTVDFYAEYEVAAGTQFTRKWEMDTCGLSYAEPMTSHAQAGTYLAMFRYTIPVGSASDNAVFNFNVYYGNRTTAAAKGTSVGIVVEEGGGGEVVNSDSQTAVFNYTSSEPGLFCGHLDVDTAHLVYPPGKGSTDGHVHEWDDKFNSTFLDCFNLKTSTLKNVQQYVTVNDRFKIIVANADLSPGARLVINQDYVESDPSSYTLATIYDDTPLAELPVYSLSGLSGTTKLDKLQVHFLTTAIRNRQVHPTNTGDVRGNVLGPAGETRNGALTLQLVKVNADGTNAFTTLQSYSNGGVHGAATTGLLWELIVFWHWGGPSHHDSGWKTYDASQDYTCTGDVIEPSVLASSEGHFKILPSEPLTASYYPANGVARMCWEDLQNSGDFDYNDFVGDLAIAELRTSTGALKQMSILVKARARGATDNTKAWQFNLDGAFQGAAAQARVDQYYDDGDANLNNDSVHKHQAIWNSTNGFNVPIFVTTRDALPKPANSSATTNTVKDTTYIEGDYALVTLTFEQPIDAALCPPMPYSPELRVQEAPGSAYVYHLWRRRGDARLANGYPQGGFIVPGTFPWPMEGNSIGSVYPAFDAWTRWLSSPAQDDPRDPNAYLAGTPTMTFGQSIFGSPKGTLHWISGIGEDEFHLAGSGQLTTLNLLKYLNGDTALTASSRSKTVLRPLQAPQPYFSKAPLRLTNIKVDGSDGYNDLKPYLKDGISTSKPLDWQLGAQLMALVVNVERGRVQPQEWIWIPELGQIRPVVADEAHMPGLSGVIAEANATWGLPAGAANDAKKVLWRDVCARINANSYIVQQQYWPEPTPRWYEQQPIGQYFQRSLFK